MGGDASRLPKEDNNVCRSQGLQDHAILPELPECIPGVAGPPNTARHSCQLGEQGERHLIPVQSPHSPPSSKTPWMKHHPCSIPVLKRSKMLPCRRDQRWCIHNTVSGFLLSREALGREEKLSSEVKLCTCLETHVSCLHSWTADGRETARFHGLCCWSEGLPSPPLGCFELSPSSFVSTGRKHFLQ